MKNSFEPCLDCPFDAKSEKDCSPCTNSGDDFYEFSPDYSPTHPWNAPGMSVSDFI